MLSPSRNNKLQTSARPHHCCDCCALCPRHDTTAWCANTFNPYPPFRKIGAIHAGRCRCLNLAASWFPKTSSISGHLTNASENCSTVTPASLPGALSSAPASIATGVCCCAIATCGCFCVAAEPSIATAERSTTVSTSWLVAVAPASLECTPGFKILPVDNSGRDTESAPPPPLQKFPSGIIATGHRRGCRGT